MAKDMVVLSEREQVRIRILNELLQGALGVEEVSRRLEVSVRQVWRMRVGYLARGAAAIAHGNRDRPAHNRLDDTVREQVLELARGRYADINDSHLAELLERQEGIHLSRSGLRLLLRGAGLPSPQTRRAPKHRQRRERMPRAGMLVQLDTSEHPWFGPDLPRAALAGAIDDARSEVLAAHFQEHENTLGYFRLVHDLVMVHGVPEACYVDRHAIFLNNGQKGLTIDQQIAGAQDHPSQFAQLLSRLGVALIYARSPQAKGRIERLWRTFQDRLVVELRLAGITSIQDANAFLPAFLDRFNARFRVTPKDQQSAFATAPQHLADLFTRRLTATVRNDHTVQRQGLCLQLTPATAERSYCRCRVEIWRFLDDHLEVRFQGQRISAHPIPLPVRPQAATPPIQPTAPPAYKGHTPAPNHPWRRYPRPLPGPLTDLVAEQLTDIFA